MAGRISKRRLILDCREQRHIDSAGVQELRRIQNELRIRLTPAAPPSLSYIAGVLREAGTRVDYDDPYADPVIPERYRGQLEDALQFSDLAAAEASLRRFDAACRQYESSSDREGAALVRKLVLRGRQRASSLAANARVDARKRQEKREIASWFRLWLENQELFFDWLEVRKNTEEFRELFCKQNSSAAGETSERAES